MYVLYVLYIVGCHGHGVAAAMAVGVGGGSGGGRVLVSGLSSVIGQSSVDWELGGRWWCVGVCCG